MELIVISDSKLKIMLSESDLESYSLTSEILDYENADTREAFKCILDEAKIKTGFDTECGRLFIKVFPSKNGGCEVYVTRSSGEKDKEKEKEKEKAQAKKTQIPGVKREICIFRLEDIDCLCCACRCLIKTGYTYESRLYYEEKENGRGIYYLVLQEDVKNSPQTKKKRLPDKCDVVCEFGKKIKGNETFYYIKEHCREICDSKAIEKMGRLL